MPGFVLGPHEGPAYGFHGAHIVIKASGSRPATALVITGPSQLDRQIAASGEAAPHRT
jgi:hypothetical protein